eukprot:3342074-Lingulodinium_polyedra.AAC.1
MEAMCVFHCSALMTGDAARARRRATLSANFSRVIFQSPSRRRSINERVQARDWPRAFLAAGASQAPRYRPPAATTPIPKG